MSRILDFSDGFTSASEPTGSGSYVGVTNIAIDQPVNTVMTLPSSGNYVVGINQLKIFLNGLLLEAGNDYNEIGASESLSTQIEMLDYLVAGDKLTFRT